MFCCAGLENLFNAAGERGIAAMVREEPDRLMFMLQSRGIAFEDEQKKIQTDSELIVNISCNIGMLFCPFCGTRLKDLVARDPKAFHELASRQRKYFSTSS
jgi:hypothetical protein